MTAQAAAVLLSKGCTLERVAYHIVDGAYDLTIAVPDRGSTLLQCKPSRRLDQLMLQSSPGITYLL